MIPYLASLMIEGIVFGPPTDYLVRFPRGRLLDSHCESWPLMLPLWLVCVMVSGYFSCKVTIDSDLCDTLGYG
jgi:hypothetical protein